MPCPATAGRPPPRCVSPPICGCGTTPTRSAYLRLIDSVSAYLRLIDSCINQLEAQGPSRTCNESKEEEEDVCPKRPSVTASEREGKPLKGCKDICLRNGPREGQNSTLQWREAGPPNHPALAGLCVPNLLGSGLLNSRSDPANPASPADPADPADPANPASWQGTSLLLYYSPA